MGLGLTICKMILERHNGQISIAQVHLTAWRFAWSCLLLPTMPIHGTMSGQKGKSGDAIATYRFSLKADKRRSREIRKMPASHVATHLSARHAQRQRPFYGSTRSQSRNSIWSKARRGSLRNNTSRRPSVR